MRSHIKILLIAMASCTQQKQVIKLTGVKVTACVCKMHTCRIATEKNGFFTTMTPVAPGEVIDLECGRPDGIACRVINE